MVKNIIAILLLGILLIAGCTYQQPPLDGSEEQELSFETVQNSQSCLSQVEPLNTVITSIDEFKRFFVSFEEDVDPEDLSPPVDLSKEMIIGVFQGQKPTGGFSTEITKISEDKNKIKVYYTETSPDSNDIVTQATTTPCHLVKTKRSSKEVIFIRNSVSGNEKPPLPPKDDDSEDANFKEIQLNKEFTLEIGKEARYEEADFRIKFLEVTEDSRCPSDVQCIRAGDVSVKIDARFDNEKNLGLYELTLEGVPSKDPKSYVYINGGIGHSDYIITLTKVEPYPKSGIKIDSKDYIAAFKLDKVIIT